MTKKRKKLKSSGWTKKPKFNIVLFVIIALIIFWLGVGVFLYANNKKTPELASIYVSSKKVKQGDTVFVRVNSRADEVRGAFGQEKLSFYKKPGTNEWFSFLGIDADQNPGDYNISVDTSNNEHLTDNVNVSLADFSSAPPVAAPGLKQTGITMAESVNNIIKNDNPTINNVLDNLTANPYFTGPFSFPLSSIKISGFSFGKFIGFGKNKLQHFGVDLQARDKTNIYAVNDGKVVGILNLPNYGKILIIDHGLNIFSMYLHLDKFNVAIGDMVSRGQLIGLSGKSGYAAGPHLHFSMRVDGKRVDPLEFIQKTQQINDNSFIANVSGGY